MKKIILAGYAAVLTIGVYAQQLPLTNQYTINKFMLSPAYAGTADGFEIFGSYRNEWLNIPNAPETRIIAANGNIGNNMGLGGIISSQSAGLFQTLTASASYAYHLNFSGGHMVSLGLGVGMLENRINFSGAAAQADPVAASNASAHSMVLDAGFGILYRCKGLSVGISIPRLMSNKIDNAAGKTIYTLAMQEGFNIGYKYSVNADWAIDPVAKVSMVQNAPLFYEVAIPLLYKNKIWIAPAYKKTSMAFAVGGIPYNRLIVNYAYEFSSMGIMGYSGGTHEIT
ncbi:MAG TPA: PorP/SprF family type IX secretion system membrane protein, partial [Bacteroidia bacterium]